MNKLYFKDSYKYKRILEILEDYWLTQPDEESVIVNMSFRHHNGETQEKRIVWVNPKYATREDAVDCVKSVSEILGALAGQERDESKKVIIEILPSGMCAVDGENVTVGDVANMTLCGVKAVIESGRLSRDGLVDTRKWAKELLKEIEQKIGATEA